MKVLILSDLHLELGSALTLPTGLEYDAVVLAGDIHSPGHKAVHWAQRESTFGGRPVLMVPGNHEFYGREMATELVEMRKAATGSNVQLLDRGEVVVGGVRFLGCTLWTDFQWPVRNADSTTETDVYRALAEANRRMMDFRLIELQAPAKRQYRGHELRRLLRAEDTLAMHWVDRDWLRHRLAESFDGPTVVVTHHGPAGGSVAERYAADWLTPAFVSDLPQAFFEVPALWVHGHTHSPFDYLHGACRVLSNPRGYRMPDGTFENHLFSSGLIVEVPVDRGLVPMEGRAWAGAHAGYGTEHSDERRQEHERQVKEFVAPADGERPAVADTAWMSIRASAADMVGEVEAAALAGVSPVVLRAWVALRHPRVIAIEHSQLGPRFPRWQFESAVWPVVQRLPQALPGDHWTMLAWLETPLGALGGRTPRAALEQGELAERVLALAAWDGV